MTREEKKKIIQDSLGLNDGLLMVDDFDEEISTPESEEDIVQNNK